MAIFQASATLSNPSYSLASTHSISSPQNISISLLRKFSTLSLHTNKSSVIRMGGGPRTFPGGVSKWQWKRMQAKKAKQLLKARLSRERQIYEMRKRAELKAAVSELERPWEVVERPSALFSVGADEQLKVLADRFQKPGGFDLWSERDGPQLFETPDGLPTARFFPKGVVHSVKPYRRTDDEGDGELVNGNSKSDRSEGGRFKGERKGRLKGGSYSEGDAQVGFPNSMDSMVPVDRRKVEPRNSVSIKNNNRSRIKGSKPSNGISRNVSFNDAEATDSEHSDSASDSKVFSRNQYGRSKSLSDGRKSGIRRRFSSGDATSINSSHSPRQMRLNEKRDKPEYTDPDVYYTSLQQDGSYSLD